MENLKEETLLVLRQNGKTFDDVVAVMGEDFQITKEDFLELADTLYDDGYGSSKVATDLCIVGEDFWLERYEYDGSEWWEFKAMPRYEHLPFKKIHALTVYQSNEFFDNNYVGWEKLSELNQQEEY